MKKTWTTPLMETLEISQTAGGTHYTPEQDGPVWTDKDGHRHYPTGDNDILSEDK